MKRLYRNKSDVMLAGVCSGLGEYLDVDPTAIRLIFVLLLFVGFGGLWIYLVLWIIMPEKPEQENEAIEVKQEVKTPTSKKVAAPRPQTAKRAPAKKAPAKKPAEKKQATKAKPVKKPSSTQSTKQTTAKTEPAVENSSVQEKKE